MYNIFDKIDHLKSELSSLTISDKDQRRLDEKFRLEFNYNSNHMEGNTLTYQDTKVLLLKDILPQGKLYEMRELDEMRAHDAAYSMIQKWATDPDREITQQDIRDLNKVILIKDFYKDAITHDGSPTRKKIKVGDYKETPNSVLLSNGEIFHYADPIEVPVKMQDLMDWYQHEKDGLHPITLAAVFHHKFVLIHPFDDGNGRISRLLMNYILIRFGYPPVVIKSANKDKYLNALRLADAGDMESFISYIAEQAEWSLEIAIKAAKGESIDEKGDLNKKLDILLKSNNLVSDIEGKFSIENLDYLMDNSLNAFFLDLEEMLLKFDKFFNERRIRFAFDHPFFEVVQEANQIQSIYYEYSTINDQYYGDIRKNVHSIDFKIELSQPVNINHVVKDVESENIVLNFFTNRIEVKTNSGQILTNFTYHGGIDKDQIDKIIEFIGNDILNKMSEVG